MPTPTLKNATKALSKKNDCLSSSQIQFTTVTSMTSDELFAYFNILLFGSFTNWDFCCMQCRVMNEIYKHPDSDVYEMVSKIPVDEYGIHQMNTETLIWCLQELLFSSADNEWWLNSLLDQNLLYTS